MSETIIRVVLADAPRDVLVRLVDHGSATREEIVDGMAPSAPDLTVTEVGRRVLRATKLLHELGFVRPTGNERRLLWEATADGRHIVMAARAEAQRDA